MSHSFLRIVGFALLLAFTAGCSSNATLASSRIADFATATQLAMQNTTTAFQTVELKHSEMIVARLSVDYETKGFNPKMVTRFLSPDELAARAQILTALKHYAEMLAVIMGNTQLEKFDAQTKQFGVALAHLNQDLVKTQYLSKNASINDTEIGIFTTAVNTLGKWFVEWKRERTVREEISIMQPAIADIARLLREDIGTSRQEEEAKAAGLRNELWNTYTDTIQTQDAFITHNWNVLTPNERREEIRKLTALVTERTESDATLAATRNMLQTLVATHQKLVNVFDKHTVELDGLVSQLISEGNRIKIFYDALSGKK